MRPLPVPKNCPSCDAKPALIHQLPLVAPYTSDIGKRHPVIPERDDFRCRWCGSHWNERERVGLKAPRMRH